MKEKGIMKQGQCECGRHDKLYNGKCYWCFIEAMRETAGELEKEMTDNVSLIGKEKLKPIRDKMLDLI